MRTTFDCPQLTADSVPPVVLEEVTVRYETLLANLKEASTPESVTDCVEVWDRLRRANMSWMTHVYWAYNRDTVNPEATAQRRLLDEQLTLIRGWDADVKRHLLSIATTFPSLFSAHLLAVWKADVAAFDDSVLDLVIKENVLKEKYTRLMASAEIPFQGEVVNLSGISRYANHHDRALRKEAEEVKWAFFEENGEQFDAIFESLSSLRREKAQRLGFNSPPDLSYQEMKRFGYHVKDVAAFRQNIIHHVVPLVHKVQEKQRENLGLERLMAWDQKLWCANGNPAPTTDPHKFVEHGVASFEQTSPLLGDFFKSMRDHNLLDLHTRQNKADGGYCASIPLFDMPVVFCNSNGSAGDVIVLTHEIGHAFQTALSSSQTPFDLRSPTMELAEVHSMSLEFLTWPHMEHYFGDRAEDFRQFHLMSALSFLPYGCAVDHFQHDVYSQDIKNAADRHALWHKLEQLYLPDLDWGEIPYPKKGGRWQAQLHIMLYPFYYIDYVLAYLVALQFWTWSLRDQEGALKAYTTLCQKGGCGSFLDLVQETGLKSPFDESTIEEVCKSVADYFELTI